MKRHSSTLAIAVMCISWFAITASAQVGSNVAQSSTPGAHGTNLSIRAVESSSEIAGELANPECDGKGNVYFDTWPDGVHAIHKLNANGERVGVFLPEAPGVRIDMPLDRKSTRLNSSHVRISYAVF